MADILVPNNSTHDVVSYELMVDGAPLDPSFQVMSISVTRESNRVPTAKIIFRDGEAAERDFALSNNAVFVPGKTILVKMGYDSQNEQVFQGIIAKHAIKVKSNGNSELHIECRDAAVKMTIGRHSKYYQQMTDEDLFRELVTKYGLQVKAAATSLTHKEIVQHHITDWDFLLLRAEANGMLVHVNDGTVEVAEPATDGKPVLLLTYGISMHEFEAEMDIRNQYQSVKTASWDYKTQQLFNADSTKSKLSEAGNISGNQLSTALNAAVEMHHSGHLQVQELQSWADGAFMRSRLAKIRGRVKCDGFAAIKPGDMIQLEGVGDRFNGNVYVTALRQDMADGAWYTHLQFGMNPEYHVQQHKDIADVPNAGLAGPISGLHIGKVVQLQSDPDGEHRILVKIPTIDNNAQGIWTRVATLDAGSNRGSFFLPEIDDEVIVGFINDDPRHAVMLGMLHSSAKPAPIVAADDNHKKGFTTRSSMHISFDDDTKIIVIDTPAGNKITLDEKDKKIEIKDQSNNIISMTTSGIKMESPKNIEIKAGANCTISAKASLSVTATSISIKADADVSVQGAIAKLSSQGITEVTGSIVKIN